MKWINNASEKIINIVLASLAGFSLVYAITTTLSFPFGPVFLFTIIAAIQLVFSFMFFNHFTTKTSAIVIGLVTVIFLLILTVNKNLQSVALFFTSYYEWLTGYICGFETLNPVYSKITTVTLCILASLLAYIFITRSLNFYVILISGVTLFVAQWMYGYFVSYLSFFIFMVVVIICYFKFIYKNNYSNITNKHINPVAFSIFSLIISLLIVGFSMTLPTSSKPIEWEWLDKRISKLYNQYNVPTHEFFSLATTGFASEEKELGGKVKLDDTLTLEVESPEIIYLKGASPDFYTGYSWKNTSEGFLKLDDEYNGVNLDLLELNEGFRILSEEEDYLDKYFNLNTIKIRYRKLNTKSLFVPVKTKLIEMKENNSVDIFVTPNDVVFANEYLKQDCFYTLKAYHIKYADKEFQNILKRSYRGIYYDIIKEMVKNDSKSISFGKDMNKQNIELHININNSTLNTLLKLENHASIIYTKYLKLPDDLPERVVNLAHEITSDAVSNYDKAKAIENYLSGNYPYTLSPGDIQRGEDFVESFLFDVKEGYCTYYASAMTVLARCIGLPARYVEGYVLPSKPESGNTYKVTNKKAHAWVELYFEGFGWLPFEPTAPFIPAFYGRDNSSTNYSSEFYEDPLMEDYIDELDSYAQQYYDPGTSHTNNFSGYEKVVYFITILLVIIILVVLLYNILRITVKFYKIKAMKPDRGIKALFEYYLKILKFQKLGIRPGETPYQYAERVDKEMVFAHTKFVQITKIFVRARYSKYEMNESEKNSVLEFYKDLIGETKDNLGKVKYFFSRYISGSI